MAMQHEHNNELELVELLAERRIERLAALVKGQPQAFWDVISARLDASPDGSITEEDIMEALREGDINE